MLRMADSASPDGFPKGFDAYAGYVNGKYLTYTAAKRHRKPTLAISVYLADIGECLDIESGDATPADGPKYVRMRRKAGVKRPVLYSSISDAAAVVAACRRAGVARRSYRVWSAHFTLAPHICGPKTCGYPTQAEGTQWSDKGGGGKYDESLLPSHFFKAHRGGSLWRLRVGGFTVWSGSSVLGWLRQLASTLRGKLTRR